MAVIVVADDSAELRALYGSCLQMHGHEVHEACDGREAVEVVRRYDPDLLLLDVWMPHRNGFEVLDVLRNEALAARLKVVMLSVLGDGDSRLEGFAGGVVEYLVKGLSLDELVARIEAILAAPGFPDLGDPDGAEPDRA